MRITVARIFHQRKKNNDFSKFAPFYPLSFPVRSRFTSAHNRPPMETDSWLATATKKQRMHIFLLFLYMTRRIFLPKWFLMMAIALQGHQQEMGCVINGRKQQSQCRGKQENKFQGYWLSKLSKPCKLSKVLDIILHNKQLSKVVLRTRTKASCQWLLLRKPVKSHFLFYLNSNY